MFLWRNKKNINTFELKKNPILSRAMCCFVGSTCGDIPIVLECLDVMVNKRKRQVCFILFCECEIVKYSNTGPSCSKPRDP